MFSFPLERVEMEGVKDEGDALETTVTEELAPENGALEWTGLLSEVRGETKGVDSVRTGGLSPRSTASGSRG